MSPDELRAALLRALALENPEKAHGPRGDDGSGDGAPTRDAAVLVPFVAHAEEPTLLLTLRTPHLRSHAGQVSFPGGRCEEEDDGPVGTALREAREEIGLDASRVEVLGVLDSYETITGFRVCPVVGFVTPGFSLEPDHNEVAEVFELPARLVLDRERWVERHVHYRGRERCFYELDWDGKHVWGATAGMLVGLCQRLAAL